MLLPLALLGPALQTLVVGGGPSPQYNQVAIESNVRYMGKLVQPANPFRVLFADGYASHKSVRFTPPGATDKTPDQYRTPQVPRMDGPASKERILDELTTLSQQPTQPVLLYFTGHGSIGPQTQVSQFDLWNGRAFGVADLIGSLTNFDAQQPITLLMVQCHSSDFANALYLNGDAKQGFAPHRFCGFFASISARPAAGCTPALDEEYYRDFSSYFLSALTGTDRLGRKVTGADYDHNGWVGMNEAFCWSLVNDDSIDTPVCTSDVFLRDAVPMTDPEIFKTSYASVLSWATKPQRAALTALSSRLKLTGDNRLAPAYAKYLRLDINEEAMPPILGYRFIRLAKSVILAHELAKVGTEEQKARYEQLIKDEASNPFTGQRP